MDERSRRFALAAGAVGVLANLLLIGFYALELGREPVGGVSLGWLNDLDRARWAPRLMIPVALAFGPAWLRALGITAMTVATVGGLLLVFGVLTFEQQLPIVLAAFVALALWMLLTARQLTGAAAASVCSRARACSSGCRSSGSACCSRRCRGRSSRSSVRVPSSRCPPGSRCRSGSCCSAEIDRRAVRRPRNRPHVDLARVSRRASGRCSSGRARSGSARECLPARRTPEARCRR